MRFLCLQERLIICSRGFLDHFCDGDDNFITSRNNAEHSSLSMTPQNVVVLITLLLLPGG